MIRRNFKTARTAISTNVMLYILLLHQPMLLTAYEFCLVLFVFSKRRIGLELIVLQSVQSKTAYTANNNCKGK